MISPRPWIIAALSSNRKAMSEPNFRDIFCSSVFESFRLNNLLRAFRKEAALEEPPPSPPPTGMFLVILKKG